MIKKKINVKSLLKDYNENPVLTRACTIHRTHKKQKMDIPKGSYLHGIYTDKSKDIVIKKSTQSGISEYLIAKSFYSAEIGRSVFYVLPTFDLKNMFVKERVEKSIFNSPYYLRTVTASRQEMTESQSLKQFGAGVIYYVGSNTSNSFVSFPADIMIIDELDQCHQDNLIMGVERLSASKTPETIKVGNPTIGNYGIDSEYMKSDQKKWFIKCDCGEWVEPDFFKHVVIETDQGIILRDRTFKTGMRRDINMVCDKCGKPIDRFGFGEWVAQTSSDVSGYQNSKLFSTQVTLIDMVKKYSEAITNETVKQRFYNGDLGEIYSGSGAGVTPEMLDKCVSEYSMPSSSSAVCVAGIDVGTNLNIIIAEVLSNNELKVVNITQAPLEYEDASALLRQYNVKCFVIDSMPEIRFSKKLVSNFFGFTCNVNSSNTEMNVNPKTRSISVIRTAMLDAVRENVLTGAIRLPINARSVTGYYEQMCCSTRIYDDKKGKFDWQHGSVPDHYFFATGYLLLARRLFVSMAGI